MERNNQLPLVSVIITTKNEEGDLGDCLDSLKKQDFSHHNLEIIVVDNNSTDKTKEVLSYKTPKHLSSMTYKS